MVNVFILAATVSTVVLCTYASVEAPTAPTLRLLTLLPDGDPSRDTSSSTQYGAAIRLASDLAAEQINNRTDLLPYHQLELIHKESGCAAVTKTLHGLTRGLFPSDGSTVVGIIGPPMCSLDSTLVSSITNRPDLKLVTLHNSGSPLLQDSAAVDPLSTELSYSLDILGSVQQLVDLSLALINKSGWRNVSILYENNHPFYRSIARSFISFARDEFQINVNYLSTVDSNFYPLREVWNNKARIVFVFTSAEYSRRIMCLAHHLKMVYPDYQFVLTNPKIDDFTGQDTVFTYNHEEYRCSQELLVNKSLDRAFLISHRLTTPTPNKVTFTNITFKRFLELYEQRIDDYNTEHPSATISPTYRAYSLYDAIWAWAIILDELVVVNKGFVFKYGNQTLAKFILEKFYSLNFQGMSGEINFDSTSGHVNRPANLYQKVDEEATLVAYSNGTHVGQFEDIHTIADLVIILNLPHIGIVGFFLTIHCIEFIIVIALHICTFIYRNTKVVKASSPKLVQPAYFGTYIFILTMTLYILFFIKEHNPTVGVFICQLVWGWLLSISFTLTMGIVSLRTWRVYRIFFHYLNPGKLISNPALLSILLMMVSVDLLIGTLWTALDTMDFYLLEHTTENIPANEVFLDQICFSRYNTVWIGIVFSYRFILLLIMVTLSLLTRNIPNQTFATASLRVFSYIFSIVMIVGFVLYFLFLYLIPHLNIEPIILCTTLNIMLILFVVCILAPPLIPVIQNRLRRSS